MAARAAIKVAAFQREAKRTPDHAFLAHRFDFAELHHRGDYFFIVTL